MLTIITPIYSTRSLLSLDPWLKVGFDSGWRYPLANLAKGRNKDLTERPEQTRHYAARHYCTLSSTPFVCYICRRLTGKDRRRACQCGRPEKGSQSGRYHRFSIRFIVWRESCSPTKSILQPETVGKAAAGPEDRQLVLNQLVTVKSPARRTPGKHYLLPGKIS